MTEDVLAQGDETRGHAPLVSVIIPVYDQGRFLPCSVESVLAQDLSDLELILVDDGSHDGSQTMCDAYAREDPRVRVIHQANGGAAAARNAGIDVMRGAWVTFVDADDWIGPTYLSTMIELARSNGTSIAMSRVVRFKDPIPPAETVELENGTMSGREACRITYYTSEFIIDALWGKVYRSELFETLRLPVGMTREDAAVMHELLYPQETIALCRSCPYGYRTNPDGVMARPFGRESFDALDALSMRMAYFECMGDEELVQLERSLLQSWNALFCGKALVLGKGDEIPQRWRMPLGELMGILSRSRQPGARTTLGELVARIQSGELHEG